jgi:AcrR family transcriptional regulator
VEAFLAGLEDPAVADDEATAAMLDATSALLATYGVRRWSMDDVAERSGVARATVYRRFESRDELVHATLARDARRFFEAIAEAVAHIDAIEDKVVEGVLVGLRLARQSLMPGLHSPDTSALLSLLTAAPVLALARSALVERYQVVTGVELPAQDLAEAELVAEALVRLGVSFVLMPDSVVDLDDTDSARRSLRRVVGPLLAPAR